MRGWFQTGVAGLVAFAVVSCVRVPDAPEAAVLCRVEADSVAPSPSLYAAYGTGGPTQCLSLTDLMRLESVTLDAAFPQGKALSRWTGAPVSAVLAALNVPANSDLRLTALDGYQVTAPASLLAEHEPVLAYQRDGDLLALGDLGPLILVWPRHSDPRLNGMTDDLWPWAIFTLEALPQTLAEADSPTAPE